MAPKDPYFGYHPLETMPLVEGIEEDRADIPPAGLGSQKKEQLGMTDLQRRECRQAYNASISFMDAQVGKVLDALKESGQMDNTLIVLFGDHGYHLGEHGGVWQKRTLFEESARAPLIVRWPGAEGNGRLCRRVVEFVDLYPTLVEAAGLAVPPGLQASLERRSWVPGRETPTRVAMGPLFGTLPRPGEVAEWLKAHPC